MVPGMIPMDVQGTVFAGTGKVYHGVPVALAKIRVFAPLVPALVDRWYTFPR